MVRKFIKKSIFNPNFKLIKMKSYLSILITLLIFISCSSLDQSIENQNIIDYDALNETEIQNYISENNLVPKKSNSGLYYIIKEKGTGQVATFSSNVTVSYKGYTTDKVVFEESKADGVSFDLNNLIQGFTEGVTYLKEGGEATLIIPSKIGYPHNLLPPHSLAGKVVIFDIKLISVN